MTDYTMLPNYMQDAARKYVEDGVFPGVFLTAVLENNLVEAYGRADGINAERMRDWVEWLYNKVPAIAWGSKARIKAWCRQGGEKGLVKALEKKRAGY